MLWPLICLLLIEVIAFGINVKQVGVYQDDWYSFNQLHFVPHALPNLIAEFNSDPRKILRPLECLNIPVMFYFAGEKPFWYHIASYASEFLSAWFLYLSVTRLVRDRALALAVSILFLLYPTHSSSHCAIVLWDLTVATWFYTMSVWLLLKGIDEGRNRLIFWSALAYLVSLLNWEFCLPLVVLYPLLSLLYNKSKQQPSATLKRLLAYQVPFVLVAASVVAYRSWLALSFKNAFPTCFSLPHFLSVITAGINVSLSPSTFSFCASMLADSLKVGLSISSFAGLLISGCCIVFCLLKEGSGPRSSRRKCLVVVLVGTLTLLLSYTIFAVSQMHMPAITGYSDRVNIGGSLGACLILAGLLGVLRESFAGANQQLKRVIFAVSTSILAVPLILIDWQSAKPWITSWETQKELISLIKCHASEIKPGDSIIVGDIHRYVEGVAVVDLPWQLENILRTSLNCRNIKGAIVTERLMIKGESLVDRIGGHVFGTFPFEQMILYAPGKSQWLRISTRQEFVQAARKFGWAVAGLEP